jgi:hypothetical protein
MGPAEIRALVARLNGDAAFLAARFGLCYRAIEAERPNVKRRYGVCYSDGTIRIRLHHATTREPLKYSSLVNTLCHELAHLRHFNHGPRFRAFYLRILEYARSQGIYRPRSRNQEPPEVALPETKPRPRAPRSQAHRQPEQLVLFGG